MKRRLKLAAGLMLLASSFAVRADDAAGAALLQPAAKPTPSAAVAESPNVKAPRTNVSTVKVSGYFVDVSKEPKKKSLFNLRTPVDPAKDTNNIVLDPKTQKVKGFKLLSFDF